MVKSIVSKKRALVAAALTVHQSSAFLNSAHHTTTSIHQTMTTQPQHVLQAQGNSNLPSMETMGQAITSFCASAVLVASLTLGAPTAFAENELSDKYGGKGFDSSLVDQTCLVDKCSLQAKACLADDPSCRKGLTCTAKCLGDNACITGCMARYGNPNLDNLLKCTIEDHECIKIAILPGGSDRYGEEPRAPAPTVQNFDYTSMQGVWYKTVGYNPNYDCYACQRNTFSMPEGQKDGFIPVDDRLDMAVEFSMPHMLPDGSAPPPSMLDVVAKANGNADDNMFYGSKSMGLRDYQTNEVMVFDTPKTSVSKNNLVLNKGTSKEASYSRTAHSEGEMFGLKFWENWYIIGENDPDQPEFKFVYYNGKTRQNTYEGAFVYSRQRELEPESMKKVYQIAKDAGMNPDQFCKIRNTGRFADERSAVAPSQDGPLYIQESTDFGGMGSPSNPFRGILASTKVSELLGVEPVSARDDLRQSPTSESLLPPQQAGASNSNRPWWYEVGDYLENPHRHFDAMDKLRQPMTWPDEVKK